MWRVPNNALCPIHCLYIHEGPTTHKPSFNQLTASLCNSRTSGVARFTVGFRSKGRPTEVSIEGKTDGRRGFVRFVSRRVRGPN